MSVIKTEVQVQIPARILPEINAISSTSFEDGNGFRGSREIRIDLNGSNINAIKVKGNIGKGNYLILRIPETQEWIKAAGTQGLSSRIAHCADAISVSCRLNDLGKISNRIEISKIHYSGSELTAFCMPHIGPTIEYILIQNEGNSEIIGWLSSVYHAALAHALAVFNQSGYFLEDPNPGNIVLKIFRDVVATILIDFSSKRSRREVSTKNERILKDRFTRQMERNRIF